MSRSKRQPERRQRPSLPTTSVSLRNGEQTPLWKKFLTVGIGAALVYALVAWWMISSSPAQAAEIEVDVPVEEITVVGEASPEPASESGFFKNLFKKPLASLDADVSARLESLEAREKEFAAYVKTEEERLDTLRKDASLYESHSIIVSDAIENAAYSLQECALAAIKEVKDVRSDPQG